MTTTKITYSPETLAQHVAYWKTMEAVECAGYTFHHGTPQVGEQAVIYSRNNWRLGLVSHVTKTGTVSVQYVTPGGIADGQKTYDYYQGKNADDEVKRYVDHGGYSDEQIEAASTRLAARKAQGPLDFVNVTTKTSKDVALRVRG